AGAHPSDGGARGHGAGRRPGGAVGTDERQLHLRRLPGPGADRPPAARRLASGRPAAERRRVGAQRRPVRGHGGGLRGGGAGRPDAGHRLAGGGRGPRLQLFRVRPLSRIVHDGPLIIGGGLAGLSAALEAAPRSTLVVTPAPLLQACSSAWAQGGVAAALSRDDAAELHAADTRAAGAGLVEGEPTQLLTADGRATVEWLAALGAPFDRDA